MAVALDEPDIVSPTFCCKSPICAIDPEPGERGSTLIERISADQQTAS
jgi:hypothetical protein